MTDAAAHPSTVVFARHGRTAWHQPNRYTGASDIPLDEVGQAQAVALARRAAGMRLTSLACSPQLRARATAAPVAEATGLQPRVDARLREVDFGVAEGRTLDALQTEAPEVAQRFVADPVAGHFPGGEGPAAAADRAAAALAELVAADPGGTLLVVAHGTLIRLLLCRLLGVALSDYRRRLPRIDPVATSSVEHPGGPGPVRLLSYNIPTDGA